MAGTGVSPSSGSEDFVNIVEGLSGIFGGSSSKTQKGTESLSGSSKERLNFSPGQLTSIVTRALEQGGLADLFTEEDAAGIFDSSVSKQASGNLIAQITGELAKLSGEKIRTEVGTKETTSKVKNTDEGLLGAVSDTFGF